MRLKSIKILVLLLTASMLLSGCGKPEIPKQEDPKEEVQKATPLEKAREELFNEIGVEEIENSEKTENPKAPSNLPTPPALPKIDADL